MKIGLGIITYNRLDCLKKCIESIYKTDISKFCRIIVADDASTDGTQNWVKSYKKLTLISSSKNFGIASNCNQALGALQDVDFGFLINDDIFFKHPGWVDKYIRAMIQTPYKHFCYMGGKLGIGYSYSEFIKDIEISHHNLTMGSFLTFSKDILKTIGGFDIRFGKYGFEHVDWTERIAAANLTRKFDIFGVIDGNKVVDLAESYKFIGDIETESVFSFDEKQKLYNQSILISSKIRDELLHSGFKKLYKPFLVGSNVTK